MGLKAKEILKNKFWIVENGPDKVGTISYDEDRYMFSTSNKNKFFKDKSTLTNELGKSIFNGSIKEYVVTEKEVHGFPTNVPPCNSVFDVKRKLPLFTKSDKSTSLYCAGYYIIQFDKGWVKSFCPKLITCERYEYQGPFLTDLEMKHKLSLANKKDRQ
jgi:hypothetical protein